MIPHKHIMHQIIQHQNWKYYTSCLWPFVLEWRWWWWWWWVKGIWKNAQPVLILDIFFPHDLQLKVAWILNITCVLSHVSRTVTPVQQTPLFRPWLQSQPRLIWGGWCSRQSSHPPLRHVLVPGPRRGAHRHHHLHSLQVQTRRSPPAGKHRRSRYETNKQGWGRGNIHKTCSTHSHWGKNKLTIQIEECHNKYIPIEIWTRCANVIGTW